MQIFGCGEYYWEILSCLTLFFFLPYSLVIVLFVCRSCLGIKDGRKMTRIPLDSNFILGGLRLFCGCECFEPVEIVVLLLRLCFTSLKFRVSPQLGVFPLYLSYVPPTWHKAVLRPTHVRQGQKYLRPRRHSPF